MIAFATQNKRRVARILRARRTDNRTATPEWHERFLQLLPIIRRQAWRGLRGLAVDAMDDAIEEVVADAFVAYARLVELGKEDLAYASPLVRYAIAKYRSGRRVGSRLNVRDVTSDYCQRRNEISIERLDRRDEATGQWLEILVEDRHATPSDVAAVRIDFQEWMVTLSPRDRKIAERLAVGETTSDVARLFSVSSGRVSQLRHEMRESWQRFTGERAPSPMRTALFA